MACIIDFLGANALQHRISADSLGQLLDPGNALVTALGHDVGCAELAGELLPRLMTAHRDDALGTHLLGGKHTEEADRTVTDDGNRAAGLHVGGFGGEPAGAHDIGERQQIRDQVIRGNIPSDH